MNCLYCNKEMRSSYRSKDNPGGFHSCWTEGCPYFGHEFRLEDLGNLSEVYKLATIGYTVEYKEYPKRNKPHWMKI